MVRVTFNDGSIAHSGVKGMHWGDRRYQYKDMSLTPEGREHYGVGEPRGKGSSKSSSIKKQKTKKEVSNSNATNINAESKEKKGLTDRQKKALKIGAAVAGTALVAYGGYKLSGVIKDKAFNKSLLSGKAEVEKFLNNPEAKDFLSTSKGNWLKKQVRSDAMNDVYRKASKDSKNVITSINTLRGHSGMSTAGLKNMGIKTVDISDGEKALSKFEQHYKEFNSAKSTATSAAKTAINATKSSSSGINLTLNPGTSVSMKDVMASASKMSFAAAKSSVENSGIEDYTMDLLKKVSNMH